jgi:hypothetical protein
MLKIHNITFNQEASNVIERLEEKKKKVIVYLLNLYYRELHYRDFWDQNVEKRIINDLECSSEQAYKYLSGLFAYCNNRSFTIQDLVYFTN